MKLPRIGWRPAPPEVARRISLEYGVDPDSVDLFGIHWGAYTLSFRVRGMPCQRLANFRQAIETNQYQPQHEEEVRVRRAS